MLQLERSEAEDTLHNAKQQIRCMGSNLFCNFVIISHKNHLLILPKWQSPIHNKGHSFEDIYFFKEFSHNLRLTKYTKHPWKV